MQAMGGLTFSSQQSVTPSDTTRVTWRAIYVGGAGNVAISPDGSTAAITYTAVPVGTILPVGYDQGRIMSTNTTATLMIALA